MKLREKLPELVTEAIMVALAVVVALAADEWRENRQERELADRALTSIRAEMEGNRQELVDNREANRALLESVQEAARTDSIPDDFSLTYEYSLLSEAAWETARVTQATHFMPLERVQSIARIHGLQRLFQESQDNVLAFILDVGTVAELDPNAIPRRARFPLATAVGLETVLVEAYDTFLARLDEEQGG